MSRMRIPTLGAAKVTTTVADWTGRQPRDFAEVAPDLAAALRDG
ncbi:hypothetical protein [Actinokineospora globicatena]|nr:hypothetical protein [Actinokineospora globicatena]